MYLVDMYEVFQFVVVVDYIACASNPCRNSGACIKHGKCICKEGYSGPKCERNYTYFKTSIPSTV